MKLRVFGVFALALADLLGCHEGEVSATTQVILPGASLHNEKVLLKYVWSALKAAGKSGRIYYPAVCQADEALAIAFPRIEVHSPPEGEIGIAAIRAVFRNNQNVTVTEDEHGIIRIRIGDIPDAILRTNISAIKLSPMGQYNAALAIGAIENSVEVQSKMRNLGLHVPLNVYNMLLVQPAEGRPHLPTSMTNVTMDQALDMVATTFKGIVMYGACAKERVFDVTFAGGVNFDDRWLNTDSPPQ